MMKLISKSELARRVNCARSHVYRQYDPGGALEHALVGTKVNLSHPDAAYFCAKYEYNEQGGLGRAAPKLSRKIPRAELAHRVTCSSSYVRKVFTKKGKLGHCIDDDSTVDLEHPDVVEFCAMHGYQEPTAETTQAKPQKSKPKPMPAPFPVTITVPDDRTMAEPEDPEDVTASELLAMPLGEVIAKFGTASHLKDYVAVVKSLVQTRGYEDDQARKRKDYIHRVHVEQLVVYIDTLNKALLIDATKNMATRAVTQVKAGESQQQVEAAMRTVLSRTIKATKADIDRRLRDV